MRRLALALFALAACESQGAPSACGPIPQVTVNVGETATSTACFTDPNGDMLAYSAMSSNSGVATVSSSGNNVTVTAVSPGSASITVTASDPGGLEGQQSFQVTVPNRAPEPKGTMPSTTVPADQTETVDASSYFSEPDGETLTYGAVSSNTVTATVSVAGATVTVTAVAKGTATVTVTATDPGGLAATQTFEATVPNRGPEAGDPIPDIEVFVGDAESFDASGHFSDPDGDALIYAVATSASGVARVSVSGGVVRVEAVRQGSAIVTVTATDPESLSAESSFEVTVPNRGPEAGDPIPDIEVFVGDEDSFDPSGHFSDPDGDALVYSASSSASGVARVSVSGGVVRVEAARQGSATVTVTATDPEGLAAESSFEVTVPNRRPEAGDPIPDIELFVGDAESFDASGHFSDPDGDALVYSASSSAGGVARVSVSGGVVSVEAAGQGSATVTVTATDPGGLAATQSFEATVPNRGPEAGDPIPDLELFVGDAESIDASGHFSDPDGDALVYSASSSAGGVARVSVSGGVVRVEAAGQGSATVTVTATDPGGLAATRSFEATVPNRGPEVGDPIPDLEVFVGDEDSIDPSGHFSDPDGDALVYSASSSASGVARVSVSGGVVRVEAARQGSATVTVTATDPGGLAATQTFEATVPNRGPEAGDPIPDLELFVGDAESFDASGHFSDPDGDALTYAVATSAGGVARVSVSGGVVGVEAAAQGSATVTVTATDPGGLAATQSFEATVPNRGPAAGDPIPDIELFAGDAESFDASGHFSDPDGDALTYAVATSAGGVARVSVSGGVVRVEAAAQGSATVTVTATDPGGLAAKQTFETTVPNRAPEAGAIGDLTVAVDASEVVELSDHFSDPDGDALSYAATSSSPSRVEASVSGSTLTVKGLSKGGATVTATARDSEGLTARQTLEVTVPNRAPEAGAAIKDIEVAVDASEVVDLSSHFSDPEGDALTYSVTSSRPSRIGVSVSGSTLTVTVLSKGRATVTATARDTEGLTARQSFEVTVPNRGPEAGDPIPDLELFVGDAESFDASGHFSDPDGDALTYAVATSAGRVARVSVSGGVVRVEAAGQGSATVTVTATDLGELAATQTFEVTVPNRGPDAWDPIPDLELFVGDAESFDASGHFTDPDGDALVYSVTSSSPQRVEVSVSGGVVRVEAAGRGSATVTVTATDPGGLAATRTFEVTVPNRGPEAGDPIPDLEAFVGDEDSFDASDHLVDPDGDPLTYAVATSASGVARVSVSGGVVRVEAAGQGTATVTVTATDPGGLAATQNFGVTIPNRGPEAGDPIPDIEVFVGEAELFDASDHLSDPDGDALTYAAAMSDGGVARVSVSGGVVRVEAAGQGSATVTVTATDPEGLSAESSFEVTVPNRAPEAGATIGDLTVVLDSSEVVELSDHFSDPDGDALSYAVTSSSPSRVEVSVSGSTLTVKGLSKGGATVTATARDSEGLTARQTFEVTVPNRAPRAVGTIADVEVAVDALEVVDIAGHFSDPDGDALTYSVTSSSPSRVEASVSGSTLTVKGLSKGGATVTATARDSEGLTARQIFEVTVPNRAPEAVGTIADVEVAVDASKVVRLSGSFSDPDGDALTYSVTSSSPSRVEASVSGSTLTVKGLSKGGATVTATARDSEGLMARQTFEVMVPNRAPEAGAAIKDMEVAMGSPKVVNLSDHFSDPDGDALTYSVTSSSPSRIGVSVSGSTLTVKGLSEDSAKVTVTARDEEWLTAQQTFTVEVLNPDRAVLVAFHKATDGPNWINSENWVSDHPLHRWYGVQTDYSGWVVSISLAGYWDSDESKYVRHGLAGSITRGVVANLPQLKRLDLSINSLTGAIPSELGDLSELDSLNLWGNSLTGAIPSELGSLSNLEYLNLWGNSLTGAIPSELGDLSELEFLSLGDNSLTGAIPPELGDLSNLESLYLHFNSLTGAIPPELGDLSKLKTLGLRSDSLTGAIPSELGDLSNLEYLDLNDNSLTGAIPPELGDLSKLKNLNLGDNSLTGAIPSELGDLSNLEYLDLNDNSLTGAIPPELGDLSNLDQLDLWDNSLTGAIPSKLGDLSKLTILILDDNLLTGALPNSFLQLELDVFWFQNNNGLCAPNTSPFTSWLDSIGNWRGPRC